MHRTKNPRCPRSIIFNSLPSRRARVWRTPPTSMPDCAVSAVNGSPTSWRCARRLSRIASVVNSPCRSGASAAGHEATKMATTNEDKDVYTFEKFLGLRNTVGEESFEPGDLSIALNVDQTDAF